MFKQQLPEYSFIRQRLIKRGLPLTHIQTNAKALKFKGNIRNTNKKGLVL